MNAQHVRSQSGRRFEAVAAAAAWIASRQHVDEWRLADLAAALPRRLRAPDRAEDVAAAVAALKLVTRHAGGVAWARRTAATRAALAEVRERWARRERVREAARARARAGQRGGFRRRDPDEP